MNIGLVCEGDASRSETAFSGTAKRIFRSLVEQGHNVKPIDASLHGADRFAAAALSFAPNRQRWRSNFRYGLRASNLRSAAARASLGDTSCDLILQIGATYDPPAYPSIPYILYCDWNMALSIRDLRASNDAVRLKELPALEAIEVQHARRYRHAAAVLTISRRLRDSFVELYGLSPERVTSVYAGPNFDPELIDRAMLQPKISPPTVLFIAKEFQRKGGDTVAQAMRIVQQALPETRLAFAGAAELPLELRELRNVDHLGLLDKNDPQQLQRLLSAYRQADLLVLPSRHDPFPTVVREAMFFSLPCVVSDIWAMPEMVEQDVSGFLVPPSDPDALAARILTLLRDPDLCQRMGAAARIRAARLFSWNSVGKAMSDAIARTQVPASETLYPLPATSA
jgi:glycosyltransferase involved in cell wall biosynthesis